MQRVCFLIAAGVLVALVGCGTPEPASNPTTAPPAAASGTATTGRASLPPVASAVPQPDPVPATLGTAATVTGRNLFGTKSATIEVTLSKPELITEVKQKTGVVVRPEKEVWAVFDVVLRGVEGTYEFNPLHFHVIPRSEVAAWRGKPFGGAKGAQPTAVSGIDTISFGSISPGNRLSGKLAFDVPRSALTDAAVVLRSLLLVDGAASAFWVLG
jgi:hypothetical protein